MEPPIYRTTRGGKVATKGGKQIFEENIETYKFYRNMMVGSFTLHALCMAFLIEFSYGVFTLSIMSFGCLLGCYWFMRFMVKVTYNQEGKLIDVGADLNMDGGTSEYLKDLIILVSGVLVLSTLSAYFWMLLLMIPVRILYSGWSSVIKPWLFAYEPEPEPVDEKKQRKMDRRVRRQMQQNQQQQQQR